MSIVRRVLRINTYYPLNLIEISQQNLIRNYKYLSSLNKKTKIAPVLKSNAYGHGLNLVAKILDSGLRQNDKGSGIPFFCVDSLYEAYELLKAHVKTPILIMGYIQPENLKVKKLPFSYAVSTLDVAQAISKYQPHAGVHLFVDTGMNREGVPFDELPEFLESLPEHLNIEALMSHLASSDDLKDPLNKTQIKNFQKALEICHKNGVYPKWVHLQNSDGLLYTSDVSTRLGTIPHRVWNVSRVGLALYGIFQDPHLKPVLTFKSKIIQVKKLQKGDRVGYSGTFTAKKPLTLGVLPLGYYDGVDRRLSNKGFVTADGTPCRIIGRVSMNITTIDLTKVTNVTIGQTVTVYSSNPADPNSIANAAKLCKTIPYDLLVHLASSTKRILK